MHIVYAYIDPSGSTPGLIGRHDMIGMECLGLAQSTGVDLLFFVGCYSS